MKTVASKSFLNNNHLVTIGFNFEENDLNNNVSLFKILRDQR